MITLPKLSKKKWALIVAPIIVLAAGVPVVALNNNEYKPADVTSVASTTEESTPTPVAETPVPVQSATPSVDPSPAPAPLPVPPPYCTSPYGEEIQPKVCAVKESARNQILVDHLSDVITGDVARAKFSAMIANQSSWIYKREGSNANDAELCNMSHKYLMPIQNAIDLPESQLRNCFKNIFSHSTVAFTGIEGWETAVANGTAHKIR